MFIGYFLSFDFLSFHLHRLWCFIFVMWFISVLKIIYRKEIDRNLIWKIGATCKFFDIVIILLPFPSIKNKIDANLDCYRNKPLLIRSQIKPIRDKLATRDNKNNNIFFTMKPQKKKKKKTIIVLPCITNK